MKISVIIPTFNRADALKISLEKIMQQKDIDFEVIVVDDGSTDHTEQVVKKIMSDLPVGAIDQSRFQYIKQKNSRQAVARNNGIKKATGEIILFGQDDIFMEPNFLKYHHDSHIKNSNENIVVLGFTTWDLKIEINDYMKFLENSGWQFGYNKLKPGIIDRKDIYKFFYTSNISMKKSFFKKEWFNEDFTCYGWEDVEIGYRLWKNHNMQLFYEPKAIGYHHHEIPESDLKKKMNTIGKSAVHFKKLQPKIKIIPSGIKGLIIKLGANKLTIPISKLFGKNLYYKVRSWYEFFVGVNML